MTPTNHAFLRHAGERVVQRLLRCFERIWVLELRGCVFDCPVGLDGACDVTCADGSCIEASELIGGWVVWGVADGAIDAFVADGCEQCFLFDLVLECCKRGLGLPAVEAVPVDVAEQGLKVRVSLRGVLVIAVWEALDRLDVAVFAAYFDVMGAERGSSCGPDAAIVVFFGDDIVGKGPDAPALEPTLRVVGAVEPVCGAVAVLDHPHRANKTKKHGSTFIVTFIARFVGKREIYSTS